MITIVPKTDTEQGVEPVTVDSRTAAKMLGISTRTLYSLAKQGKIVMKKIGWRSLYSVASIKKYAETPDDK